MLRTELVIWSFPWIFTNTHAAATSPFQAEYHDIVETRLKRPIQTCNPLGKPFEKYH